jgi:ribosome-associated heat shock protein Hsp15
VRVMRVAAFAERRGSADRAQGLYEDIDTGAPHGAACPDVAAAPMREPGAGRPTKRDRRDLEKWLRDD